MSVSEPVEPAAAVGDPLAAMDKKTTNEQTGTRKLEMARHHVSWMRMPQQLPQSKEQKHDVRQTVVKAELVV